MAGPDFKLTPEQIEHFMRYGWVRVPHCFSKEKAAQWTTDVWTRLGYSPSDKSTWVKELTHMPEHKSEPVRDFAPKAWAAICELLGGECRVAEHSATWNDAFIVNLGTKEMEGKWPEPTNLNGWHVDGDFFTHFLDSPEQALLVIPLFTDIREHAGGTMVCPGAIKLMAQYLYDHPEGVSPYMVPRGSEKSKKDFDDFYDGMIQKCDEFHEMTGETGDVILLHPLMVHSASINSLRCPRIITNPPVSVKQPFNFDRLDPTTYSIVERKTLQALGKDRLRGWRINGRRGLITPGRLKSQAKMKEKELQRLNMPHLTPEDRQISQKHDQPRAV